MEFKKITISLPKTMYDESMKLINKGLFSNISDLIRSGIRDELKSLRTVSYDFEDNMIYKDEELIKGVKTSMQEAKQGKGTIIKKDKDMDKYFEAL